MQSEFQFEKRALGRARLPLHELRQSWHTVRGCGRLDRERAQTKYCSWPGIPFHTGFPVLKALENGKKPASLSPDHRVPAFLVALSVPILLKV